MFYELIATFAAGFCAAGAVLILRHLTGGRLPRWLTPATAGAAMIGYVIWSEYSWFDRTAGALPDSFVIAQTVENTAPWRPWTYLVPFTDRFAALDAATLRTNPALPGQRLGELYLFARWMPVSRVALAVDCESARRAALGGEASFGEDGRIMGAEWIEVPAEDPVLRAACDAEAGAGG